ncbi:hypothetical protein GW830_02365 [bacterium]|nr:hypothetical protein [bacterium]
MNESGAVENLHGFIQQLELFDMDADGKTDIVTLDDSGEMNILYGTVTADGKHIFTKHLVENSLGLKLSQEVRNDGGAFSYAGLQFPTDNTPLITPDSTGTVDQSMINNIIYYKANYQSDNVVSDSTGTVSGSGNADRVFIRSAFAEGK